MDTLSEHEIVSREDRDQEIADLYNSGMTPAEIARKIGWNANRVGRRVRSCRKYGMIEGHSPRYVVEMRNAEIEIYVAAKKTDEEIAKLMNLPLDEAKKLITVIKANIRRRKRKEERCNAATLSIGGAGNEVRYDRVYLPHHQAVLPELVLSGALPPGQAQEGG